jgi:hypothetical protein
MLITMEQTPPKTGRPELNAWKVTDSNSGTTRVIVGRGAYSEERIEINTDGLFIDYDAFEDCE